MSRVERKTAGYFAKLPYADPLMPTAPQSARMNSAGTAEHLVPAWARSAALNQQGEVAWPPLPDGQTWEHLADKGDDEADGAGLDQQRKSAKRGWLHHLIRERQDGQADSPLKILEQSQDGRDPSVWLPPGTWRVLSPGTQDALHKMRAAGLRIAKKDGAINPVYTRTRVEGVRAQDAPMPGTSIGVLGIRKSFGRHQVTTVEIEQDSLRRDKADLRLVNGHINPKSGPFTARAARRMKPGERFLMRAERTVLAESGMKYTATPIPGPLPLSLAVGALLDVGPAVSGNFTAAIEGETCIEVTRGMGSKVAVAIKARDERTQPGKDRSWKASVGAFFDASIPEYFTQAFQSFGKEAIQEEVESLEDQQRQMKAKLLPHAEKFNERADVHLERRNHSVDSHVTLYEAIFDLAKPEARDAYNRLLGASSLDERTIDFGALESLGEAGGVELVANSVRTASQRGLERTFAAFGFETHKARITEVAQTDSTTKDGHAHGIEESHAVVRRKKAPGLRWESTTVGRVKTLEQGGTKQTGVGFGWQLEFNDAALSTSKLGQLLAFAESANASGAVVDKLRALHENAHDLPRRKLLGLPVGKRHVGSTQVSFSVELDSQAVQRLFSQLDGGRKEQALWQRLAAAYARTKSNAEPPTWPIPELQGDGAAAAMRRAMRFSGEQKAFIIAQNSLGILAAAKQASDPVACAQLVGKAFDLLRGDLDLAGALVGSAREQENDGALALHFKQRVEG